jgi:hypothetical protein
MTQEAFEAAIREAKRLEKKVMDYAPYEGDINIEKSLEVEPAEYMDLDYDGLFDLYERAQKIISTTSMGILAEKAGEVKVSKESREVETRLKEMTDERLKEAEEMAREPAIIEKEAEIPFKEAPPEEKPPEAAPPPEVPPVEEIELEKEAPPKEIEFEVPEVPAGEIELEKEAEIPFKEAPPEEKPPEAAPPPEVPEVPEEKAPPPPKKAVPPTLRETPDEAAARRYKRIEDEIATTLGEGADELALKKKMLELTKDLFKEKITSKREEIKMKIKVLKNMLTAQREGGKRKKAATATQFDALLAAQQEDLAHSKGKTIDGYNKQTMAVKEKFYQDMSELEDHDERKKTYESFVSSVTMLVEGLPDAVEKEKEFMSKKHSAEMQKLLESLTAKDRALRKKVEERLEYIQESYDEEFSMVKHIVGREIENLIEVAGTEVFVKPEEKKGKKMDPTEIVREINETDEGTLLYFLHSKEPDHYKKFERKQISRAEAIFKAKELLAKEKGLSDSMIRKYFSVKED